MTSGTTERATEGSLSLVKGDRLLPEGFQPGENEVIIGRGKKVTGHSGNQRFKELVRAELFNYSKAPGKTDKSFILAKILHQVRRWSKDRVGFVKHDMKTGRWHAPRDSVARVTVAQAFRDALSNRYSSSKHNKQRKRQIAKGYVSVEDAEEEEQSCYGAPVAAAALPMQAPALSLKSVVHQGMMRRASMGMGFNPAAAHNMSAQDTMAQIRSLMASNNSWNNTASTGFPTNTGAAGNMSMMMMPQGGMGRQMQQMPCRHFDQMNGAGAMPSLMGGQQLPSMHHLSQQLPPISDLEPLPIQEELLGNAQYHPGQHTNNHSNCSTQKVVQDAFLASEQTSQFFLHPMPNGNSQVTAYSMQ